MLRTTILSILMVVTLLTGFQQCSKDSSGEPLDAEETIAVETIPVSVKEMHESLDLLGDVQANQEIRVFSKIPDRIVRFAVDMGDPVKKGDLIAVVENSNLQAGVNQMEANLDQANSQLANLENEFRRMEELLNENAVSQQQYDGVKTQLEATKAQVRGLEEALKQTKTQMGDSYIRSPLNGIIGQRFLEEGDMASPQLPVVTVVQMDSVKVMVNVVEKYIAGIQPGLSALIDVKGLSDTTFTGKVTKVSPVVDPMSRMVETEIMIANPGRLLRPGMFAEVRLLLNTKPDAMVLPKYAVMQKTELERDISGQQQIIRKSHVFLIENERAHYTEIQTGIEEEGLVEVVSGLNPGDQVVLLGQNNLRDSVLVTIASREEAI